jgi:hypothetical protein
MNTCPNGTTPQSQTPAKSGSCFGTIPKAHPGHLAHASGGTFVQRHKSGPAELSKSDLDIARQNNIKSMVIVSPQDSEMLIAHAPYGWPEFSDSDNREDHDQKLRDAGVILERQSSDYLTDRIVKQHKEEHLSAEYAPR